MYVLTWRFFFTGAFSTAAVHSRMKSLLRKALQGRRGKGGRVGSCNEELCFSSGTEPPNSLLSELDSLIDAILKPARSLPYLYCLAELCKRPH